MPFLPPPGVDERILLFGSPGSGKSYAWLSILQMYERTNTEGRFWIIDNDRGASRMMVGFPELMERCRIWTPSSFDDYRPINEEIKEKAVEGDWIIIDMLSNVWSMLPGWWIENAYQDNQWDYWVEARRQLKAAEETDTKAEKSFDGQSNVDWNYIKKAYNGWEKAITLNAPCHVMALAAEKEVVSYFDKSGEKQAHYAKTNNMSPEGEKHAPHRFHTEMRIAKRAGKRAGSVASREITMVKDRGREHIWEERGGRGLTLELSEGPKFAMDYLKRVGGWKIGKAE